MACIIVGTFLAKIILHILHITAFWMYFMRYVEKWYRNTLHIDLFAVCHFMHQIVWFSDLFNYSILLCRLSTMKLIIHIRWSKGWWQFQIQLLNLSTIVVKLLILISRFYYKYLPLYCWVWWHSKTFLSFVENLLKLTYVFAAMKASMPIYTHSMRSSKVIITVILLYTLY